MILNILVLEHMSKLMAGQLQCDVLYVCTYDVTCGATF